MPDILRRSLTPLLAYRFALQVYHTVKVVFLSLPRDVLTLSLNLLIERAGIAKAIPAVSIRRGRDGSSLITFLPDGRLIQVSYC